MENTQQEAPKQRSPRGPNKAKAPTSVQATTPPMDELDAFVAKANAAPGHAIAMMFWLARLQNPEFTLKITPAAIKGFRDCTEYLKVKPKIHIYRPQGLPAQAPIPAQAGRLGIPGREAQPPKNYAVIQMTDEDGNWFKPIENNEDDFERSEHAQTISAAKSAAIRVADQLMHNMQQGVSSDADTQEAARILKMLGAQ